MTRKEEEKRYLNRVFITSIYVRTSNSFITLLLFIAHNHIVYSTAEAELYTCIEEEEKGREKKRSQEKRKGKRREKAEKKRREKKRKKQRRREEKREEKKKAEKRRREEKRKREE